jgi:cytochrome b
MTDKQSYLIWDLPVRVFHWLIVMLIGYSWYCVEIAEDMDQHFYSGYCVLTLLIFRILWGFLGTHHAKFRNMFYKPAEIMAYLKSFFSRKTSNYAGHNPLGSLSVVALLTLLCVQAVTGLFSNDEDYYFGPLSDYVSTKVSDRLTEIHHLNFDILTIFVVMHIFAVLFYLLFKRENLVTAMITGRKILSEGSEVIANSKLLLALLTLIGSASAVFLLVYFA